VHVPGALPPITLHAGALIRQIIIAERPGEYGSYWCSALIRELNNKFGA